LGSPLERHPGIPEGHRLRAERYPAVRSHGPVVARRFSFRPIVNGRPRLTPLLYGERSCFCRNRREPSSVNHPKNTSSPWSSPATGSKNTSQSGHKSHKSHKSDYIRPAFSSSHLFFTIQHYPQILPPTADLHLRSQSLPAAPIGKFIHLIIPSSIPSLIPFYSHFTLSVVILIAHG
jgi:hypothetical protein